MPYFGLRVKEGMLFPGRAKGGCGKGGDHSGERCRVPFLSVVALTQLPPIGMILDTLRGCPDVAACATPARLLARRLLARHSAWRLVWLARPAARIARRAARRGARRQCASPSRASHARRGVFSISEVPKRPHAQKTPHQRASCGSSHGLVILTLPSLW